MEPPTGGSRSTKLLVAARMAFAVSAAGILALGAAYLVAGWPHLAETVGHDFDLNLGAARRWVSGGPFYPPGELAGPFLDDGDTILYPPVALWLFAPLSLVPRLLAALAWWGVPLGILVWQWWRLRPQIIVWPLLAACLAWPPTWITVIVGNPGMIALALLALSTVFAWPAALIGVKTGLLPFALFGSWRRSWWVAAGVLVMLSIPFAGMWLEWLTVLGNSRVGGIFHSWQQFPTMLYPILVWLGRSRGPGIGSVVRLTRGV